MAGATARFATLSKRAVCDLVSAYGHIPFGLDKKSVETFVHIHNKLFIYFDQIDVP